MKGPSKRAPSILVGSAILLALSFTFAFAEDIEEWGDSGAVLSGRVETTDGFAASHAIVCAVGSDRFTDEKHPEQTTETDWAGHFSFRKIPGDSFQVFAYLPRKGIGVGSAERGARTTVKLSVSKPFQVQAINRSGKVLAGVRLSPSSVFLPSQVIYFPESFRRRISQVTDDYGRATFYCHPNFSRIGFSGSQYGNAIFSDYGGIDPWTRKSEQSVVLAPECVVEGKVTVQGSPYIGVSVMGRSVEGIASVSAKTDEQGNYRLSGLPAGAVSLVAIAPSDLSPQLAPRRARLVLSPSKPNIFNAQLEEGGLVVGKVLGMDGVPVPDIWITSTDSPSGGTSIESGSVQTKADGSFRMMATPGRNYAILNGQWMADRIPFDVNRGEVNHINFSYVVPRRTYEFHVIDADGRPASDAQVNVKSVGPHGDYTIEYDRTDQDGSCYFTTDKPEKTTFNVAYRDQVSERNSSPTGPNPVIRLHRLGFGTISGTLFSEGQPLSGVRVSEVSEWERPRDRQRFGEESVETDEYGRFRLRGVAPGPDRTISIQKDGYCLVYIKGLKLSPSESKQLAPIELQKESPIYGRLVDQSGKPVFQATVAAVDGIFSQEATSATDLDGRFKIGGVPKGTHRIRFWVDGKPFDASMTAQAFQTVVLHRPLDLTAPTKY